VKFFRSLLSNFSNSEGKSVILKMKFLVLLTFAVVFLTVFTRADDETEEEESEEHDDDESGEEAQALSSAMQLNGNNVGDINNIKG
jgi:uncharacterized protein YpmS